MQLLSRRVLVDSIQEGKQLSARAGTAVLDHFERNQPEMYNAIFFMLVDEIAKENVDMGNLFLDLCFDIIFVYKKAFGDTVAKAKDKNWFENKLSLLDAELKSVSNDEGMNSKFQQQLSDRFVERSVEAGIQLEFLAYLDEQVENYAHFKASRKSAIQLTNNLLFVVVRLMDDIYNGQ